MKKEKGGENLIRYLRAGGRTCPIYKSIIVPRKQGEYYNNFHTLHHREILKAAGMLPLDYCQIDTCGDNLTSYLPK